MELQNEVKTFTRVGLTFNQARVYLALVHIGISNVQSISKFSKVTRPNVYTIMPTLEKLGLVEKTFSIPCRFKAISLERGIDTLIHRRTKETRELQVMTKKMLEKSNSSRSKFAPPEEEQQFSMIPQNSANISKRKILLQAAQSTIDAVSTLKRLRSAILSAEASKALRRGVKIRVIIEKPENDIEINKIVGKYAKWGDYSVRYALSPAPSIFSIFDKKDALMSTTLIGDVANSTALWSCNPCFVGALQEYFEIMWLTSIKHDNIATRKTACLKSAYSGTVEKRGLPSELSIPNQKVLTRKKLNNSWGRDR